MIKSKESSSSSSMNSPVMKSIKNESSSPSMLKKSSIRGNYNDEDNNDNMNDENGEIRVITVVKNEIHSTDRYEKDGISSVQGVSVENLNRTSHYKSNNISTYESLTESAPKIAITSIRSNKSINPVKAELMKELDFKHKPEAVEDMEMTATDDDDNNHHRTHAHYHNQANADVRISVKSTGFSPPKSMTRKVCNNSAVMLTESSIANANNDATVQATSLLDDTVSSLGDSSGSASIADNKVSDSERASTNTDGEGNGEHHTMAIQKNTTTAISTRTRSSAKKVTCLSRRIPTRNHHHEQQQHHQQKQQHQQNRVRLSKDSIDINNKTIGGEIESTAVPATGPSTSQLSCDINGVEGEFDQCDDDSIMRCHDGSTPTTIMDITNSDMSLPSSAVHQRDKNTDRASQSLISIKAELDAAAKEQDQDHDGKQGLHCNQYGKKGDGVIHHQQDKNQGSSHDSNDGDNNVDNDNYLCHHDSPSHRRVHNMHNEIDDVVNNVQCKEENMDCDDDDEIATDLGFDFVASPPRRIPTQSSRILHKKNTSTNSNAISSPTPPKNAVSSFGCSNDINDNDHHKTSPKKDLIEKDCEGGTDIAIVDKTSAHSSPSQITNQRSELPSTEISNANRATDSSSCPPVGRTSRRQESHYTSGNSYPEQQQPHQERQTSQQPHHARQSHHRHHHIPYHHQTHYSNNHNNSNSTNNSQFQQQYHNRYRQPPSSSISTMQHFPPHYGSGGNNAVTNSGGSGMYYHPTSSSSNKPMHHVQQPHHLHQHNLHHHNNSSHPFIHNSNGMSSDAGAGMMWGQHPPSPDHHETGLGTSNIGGRSSGMGPSVRNHSTQSSPVNDEVNASSIIKNDQTQQRLSRQGTRGNSRSEDGNINIEEDGQDIFYSPRDKKERLVIPTSWDDDQPELRDSNRRVENRRHYGGKRGKADRSNQQESGQLKLSDGENNRVNDVTGGGGNGMDDLVMQSPAVYRTDRDPKRSPSFNTLTPNPYNPNLSFGMIDTPTPGCGMRIDDVVPGSSSFDHDHDPNNRSIFRYANIETPKKKEETGANSITNGHSNLGMEGGGPSPNIGLGGGIGNTPLVKYTSSEEHSPKKSHSSGAYSYDKLHASPAFPYFHQLSPFPDPEGRLTRSPPSSSPKYRRRHPRSSLGRRSRGHISPHHRSGEDRFSQQRAELVGHAHRNQQHNCHPDSPGSSPLPLPRSSDNVHNRGITIPSLPKIPTASSRYPHHHERYLTNGHLSKRSPIPRRQEHSTSYDNRRKRKSPPKYDGGNDQMYPSPGGFRIKFGGGVEQTKTVMKGINKAIKGGPQPNHPMHLSGPSPEENVDRGMHRQMMDHSHPNSNHHLSSNPLRTPIKVNGNLPSIVSTPSLNMTGSTKGSKYSDQGGGSTRRHSPTMPLNSIPPGQFPTVDDTSNPNMSSGGSRARKKQFEKQESILLGNNTTIVKNNKENESPIKPRQRRNPCNCKKSKCLKLYCECFAAELFCDGCNCTNCNNTKNHESIRNKAIKDTKTKNQHAFDTNIGCRCKKSACLKKYCECFEAGITCTEKCKCVKCQNFVGSQALIDRRRKIKDHKGADRVMRAADEYWKGHNPNIPPQIGSGGIRNPPLPPPPPGMFPSPTGPRQHQHGHGHNMGGHHPAHMRIHHHHPMMSPSMHGGPQHYMGPPHVMMGHSMGYSPVAMHSNPTPPFRPSSGIHRNAGRTGGSVSINSNSKIRHGMSQYRVSSLTTTPKTPVPRRRFDPHSSKKKNRGEKEKVHLYFGPRNPGQTKNSALAIFSFLRSEDIYNASLVSKAWSKMSLDEELWQFEEA